MILILPKTKMSLGSLRYLSFSIIMYIKLIAAQGDLPKDAKIVQRCPEPKNKTAWDNASKALGCTHSGKISSRQSHVYHCLPSRLLNEYVEFCGITAPIDGGNCPVLHYVNTSGRNRSPTSWNCSTFSSGCPKEFYHSKDVYMYPKCLDIDSAHRCFKADTSCIINLNSTSTIQPDVLTKNNADKSNIPFFVIGPLLFIICVLLVIIVRLLFILKRRHDEKRNNYADEEIMEGLLCEEVKLQQERRNRCTSFLYEVLGFRENKMKCIRVTELLCEIAKKIPDEKIERLKFFLKSSNVKYSKKKDREISALQRNDLFLYMDRKYDFNVNMYILMGFLEAIKEEELLQKCKKFVENPPHPLLFYKRESEDTDKESTTVFLKVAMDRNAFTLMNLQEIMNNMKSLLSCKEDEIVVRGISKGCILLDLDVKRTLINTLRNCDLTGMSKHKVFKISIMKECIFYDPKIDDNFHKKTASKQSFPGRMLDCFCLLLLIFPKLCKIFWMRFQFRTKEEKCNKENWANNNYHIVKMEPYQTNKRPSGSRGMFWTEDLRKLGEVCNKGDSQKRSEKFTTVEILEPCYKRMRMLKEMKNVSVLYSNEDLNKAQLFPFSTFRTDHLEQHPLYDTCLPQIKWTLEQNEAECKGEISLEKPKEEISEGILKRQRQVSDNSDSRNDFSSLSLRRKTMERESTKKEEDTNIESIKENQKEEIISARDQASIKEKINRNGKKEVHDLRDLPSGSDFRNSSSYDCPQEDVAELYQSIQTLMDQPAFKQHIRPDLHNIEDLNEQLLRNKDLMMRDCAIVVVGETSSGKSTLINLIIGEDIVPTDIMATTTRVCRIKYSEKRKVSVLHKDEKVLALSEFNDEEEMSEMLEDVAKTCDHRIEYIDICFPVTLLKGNIILVDTPGERDSGQDIIENKILDYLPNAMAFIYVVNVASAGGIQDEKLPHIIKHVRQSMGRMYCFDPQDAIFLLNKWDTVVPNKKKDTNKKDLYESLRDTVHEIWKDVKHTNILKFATAKVNVEEAYTAEYESFHEILKEIITKNEFRRVTFHLRYIESFIDDCDASLSSKLTLARQSTEYAINVLDHLCRDLQLIKTKRQEVCSNLQNRIETFLEETAEELNQYIHSTDFQSIVLQGTEKYTRFTIGRELNARIEKATLSWQEENIGILFQRKILQNITDNFIKLHEHLHKIKNKMTGIKKPFDVENKLGPVLVSLIAPSSTAVAGSMAMMYMSVNPRAAQALAVTGIVTGLVITGLVALDVLDNFETVTKKAYQARINKITKEKITKALQKTYAERFLFIVRSYLEGDLKYEIDKLSQSVNEMKRNIHFYKNEESNLLSLSSEITKIRSRLEEIKQVEKLE